MRVSRFGGGRQLLRVLGGALWLLAMLMNGAAQAQEQIPENENVVELRAEQQRKEGQIFYADGAVDIRYGDKRLRADHAEYNAETSQVIVRGNVQFDYQTQQLNADEAEYNVKTGRGHFKNVRALLHIMREPNSAVLVTPNPLYFAADSVDRLDENTYRIYRAVVTVCDPDSPQWTFNASEATLHVNRTLALLNANFRVFRIPLLYAPYASLPAGRRLRQSGFLLPIVGRSSVKGYVLGGGYYWAPSDWADATFGAQWLSLRGSSHTGTLRMRPWENVDMSATYFGVLDRGLPGASGVRVPQGGHTLAVKLDARLPGGWRAVANVNQLSSLTFQLVFSRSFNEAVNSEVKSNGFLTKSFNGFSLNFAANAYKDYLTAQSGNHPETAIVLRSSPEARFGSVDRAPWKRLPIYFGFDFSAGAVHRSDPMLATPNYVDRSTFAPRVTLPLHWKSWLGVTSTYSFMATRYGVQQSGSAVVEAPVWRKLGEFRLDLRPPSLERVWDRPQSRWKHMIEPQIVYTYAMGMNDFTRFIRVDEDDTVTNTNEIQYSITQRLLRRTASGSSQELASWTLRQKYYFDPTFGGALAPGQANIFRALDSVTPFGFADGPRRFSPLVSDFKIMPGGMYDVEFRTDYDMSRRRFTTAESLLKIHPRENLTFTLAHYAINASAVLQPVSNQVRLLASYGGLTRQGWSASAGLSYDIRQGAVRSELFEVNYNGSCCGLAFGYQRLSLGQIRTENQFRVSFIIANVGEFGNLRRQEKVF